MIWRELVKKNKQEYVKKILDESSRLFGEDGYDGTSTKKIAKAVGIAEGTIFNYFKTKAEIYLDVLARDIVLTDPYLADLNGDDIITIIFDLMYHEFGYFLKMPKKIMVEVAVVAINLSKSKPELIKKLAELDFKFLANLEILLSRLKDKGLLVGVEPKVLSEIIYGFVLFEIMMFAYNKEVSKETLCENIKEKLRVSLKAYRTL